MRVHVVVPLFLFVAIAVCATPFSAQAQKSATTPTPSTSTAPAVPGAAPALQTSTPDEQPRSFATNPEMAPTSSLDPKSGNPVTLEYKIPGKNLRDYLIGRECYTMRSYIVRRESADSDVTRIAGYTTCLPSSQVQVKNADQPVTIVTFP